MLPDPVAPSFPKPPSMGRKRTIHHDLPPRMARKGARYYYVSSGKLRQWTPLGTDLAKAKRLWALHDDGCASTSLTVGDLVQRYIDREERPHSTLIQYRSYHKALAKAFPIPATQLMPQQVALWRELQRERKGYANGCIALLVAACRLGHEQGECQLITVGKWKVEGRDRYLTDTEFIAIRERAPEWLQIAMDIAYLTASRPSDVRALRWSMIGESMEMRQKKTGQRMSFALTSELAAVLVRARRRHILGLYVCATERGRPITRDRLEDEFSTARRAAGLLDVQFRDIRSKAATDAARGGQDFQALLGHTTKGMSERYIKDRRTVVAEPVRRKL